MFGDYLSEGENKVYDEVDDLDSLQKVGYMLVAYVGLKWNVDCRIFNLYFV